MSAEWSTVQLQEVAELKGGYAFKSDDYTDSGHFVLRTVNIDASGRITRDGATFVSEEKSKEYERFALKPWDTLFVMVGATLGKTGIVKECDLPALLNQNMWVVRAKDERVNQRYLYYAFTFKSKDLLGWASGAAREFVRRDDFRTMELVLPPREVQDQIANFIGAIDNKIELNRQINQTLEQIAQTIYKSWFVDFEPVKAKAEAKVVGRDPERAAMCAISGKLEPELDQLPHEQLQQLAATAALFPDELVESEMGLIPGGWRKVPFGNVIEILDSKRIPLSKRQREEKKGSYPYYGAASLMDYVDDYIFDGTYVLMAEDGSVMDNEGYPTTQYVWGQFWVNNHAHVLKGVDSVSDENILLFLKNIVVAPYITGAVQLKINQKNMISIPFLKASKEIHEEFSKIIKPLYDGLKVSSEEIMTLSETREILLPKLLGDGIELAVS